jgi:hypothetical protein
MIRKRSNMSKTINELVEAARIHFENVQADINNASTRIEHIRLTTLAQEAAHLLTDLEKLADADTQEESTRVSIPVQILTSNEDGCCGGSGSCSCKN